jgi:hypothetical protein
MPRTKTPVSSPARTDAATTSTAAPKAPSTPAPDASSTTTPQAPSTTTPATHSRPRRKARLDVAAVITTPPLSTSKAPTSKSKAPSSTSKPSSTKLPASPSTASKSLATKSPAASSSTGKPSPSKPRASTRPSALDAAAQVLAGLSKAESREGITAPDLIERMTSAKLWTSPGGKTPAATLYSAMIREIARKGDASRFTRVSPGRFAASAGASPSASRSRTGDRDPARVDAPGSRATSPASRATSPASSRTRSTTAASATSKPAPVPTPSRKAARS